MKEHRKINSLNVLLMSACFVLVCFGLQQIRTIIIPLIVSYIITTLLTPVSRYLETVLPLNKKVYNALIFIILILTIVASTAFFWNSISQLISELDVYFHQFNKFIQNNINKIQAKLPNFEITNILQKEISSPVSKFIGSASSAIRGLSEITLLTFVYTLFFLYDPLCMSKLQNDNFTHVQSKIRRYITIKTITSLITGLIVALYLLIMGYKFILFLGLATFILNFIPSFGSLIATLLLIPVIGFEAENFLELIVPLVFPAVAQFFIGNIFEPKLMGNALKLSPILIIISLIFWSIVFGVYGLFLGVPLTLVCQSIIKSSDLKKRIFINYKSKRS